jgi:AcrR family transcriptional regulator
MVYHMIIKALPNLERCMGRKSVRLERTGQILDAFERCIVKHGFQGTTLEKIADEAGVTRSILRHYIGNRDDLENALIERLGKRDDSTRFALLDAQTASHRLESLIDYFIEGWLEFGRDADTVFEELIAASARNERLRNRLLNSYQSLEASAADELTHHYPDAPVDRCRTVAHAIMCLAYGHSTMWWLGFDRSRYPELKKLVGSFLQALENEDWERATWVGRDTDLD